MLETKGREWRTEIIQFYSHKNWLQIQERTKFLLSQKMNQKTVWMGAISSNFWILTSCSGFCTMNKTACSREQWTQMIYFYIDQTGPLGQTRQSPFLSRAHARKVQQTSLFHHADSLGMVSHCKIGNVNYLFGIEAFDTVGK